MPLGGHFGIILGVHFLRDLLLIFDAILGGIIEAPRGLGLPGDCKGGTSR